MSRTVYILEMDKAKAELLASGADEIGAFAQGAVGRIELLYEALNAVAVQYHADVHSSSGVSFMDCDRGVCAAARHALAMGEEKP